MPEMQAEKDFKKLFFTLDRSRNTYENWQDFIICSACAISNSVSRNNFEKREKMYTDISGKRTAEDMKIFSGLFYQTALAFEENPEQDFLGKMYMELELGNTRNGQFFTPYSVCQAMAEMSLKREKLIEHIENHKGEIAINDCACGGGATLIAAVNAAGKALRDTPYNWQNYIMLYAQDIDMTTALMCYIQISLLGAAGAVKIGNSITEPMTTKDDWSDYWITPMFATPIWQGRILFRNVQLLDKTIRREEQIND